ncbi:MAG: hypothetical protein BGP24_14625 [Lysobacterales bacterium 69-70]|nr:hypothetical protein [Xanthomonadaceae bacterium]ODU35323.1 MAG: hypothetical protein ABS97_05460 [Xanthomonadaceae bacterium SCN 69-320]ODV17213.1 MAG: hypothetical protein ABT27_17780 [Xanthomonadaceae bacterium SCN 69-25]OJY94219.1 MAG: hypothetical protein BGP24_14625 [Xanthomonadales bacterium 69-70]
MTNAFLAEFDALAREAFADAGMADRAEYRASPSATPVPDCIVLVDRGMQDVGDAATVKNPLITITAFRDQIGSAPVVNQASFEIGVERFVVVGIADNSDESRHVCVVRPQP